MASMPGEAPILVNSAGCGAALKDYGHLLDTDGGRGFAARVFDVHEWIAPRLEQLPELQPLGEPVIIQDPCHLRHVQKEMKRSDRSRSFKLHRCKARYFPLLSSALLARLRVPTARRAHRPEQPQ